jgi:hypothetical protein
MGKGCYEDGLRPVEEYDNLIVRWPLDDPKPLSEWERPTSGHLESYNGNKGGWFGGAMMGATIYLEDVRPGGGGFFLWPKSHLHVHEYMKQQPQRITDGAAPGANNENAWNEDKLTEASGIKYDYKPFEWCAQKGDLCIWHHWTVHAPSENLCRSEPRLGLIARWHHADWEEMKYDAGGIISDGDLWKHWSPETQAAASGFQECKL